MSAGETFLGGFMSTLQFTMPSRVDAIEPMMQKLAPVISRDHPQAEAQIDLALREALANAVIHGNRQDSHKKVHVRCRSGRDGTVDLIVRDEGPGFDPDSLADPLHQANMLSGHGRGVYLMRAMMDEVRFKRGGQQVHMRKVGPGC
jgi:serine/threonine-protein kinase RsbW